MTDYAYRFDSLVKASLYFNSFYILANRVVISLLCGLIWEVFLYMEKFHGEKEKIEKKIRKEKTLDPNSQKPELSSSSDEEIDEDESDDESNESSEETPFDRKEQQPKATLSLKMGPSSKKVFVPHRRSEYQPQWKSNKKEKAFDKSKIKDTL